MRAAKPRQDESAAIDALHQLGVLDSKPEAQFDALVEAASALCDVPISAISLIDTDRQWFKAILGLPDVRETPRDLAFCAHAVLADEVFEVPDATLDDRFHDNPLVAQAPHIRFYAGAPVQLSNGHRIGTLCVIDREPRQLTDRQREVLRHLALAAGRALEGRRALISMQRASQGLARAAMVEEHSADAIIGIDTEGLVLRANRAATVMFGPAEQLMACRLDGLVTHPHDAQARLHQCLTLGVAQTYDAECLHPSGYTLEVSITLVPELDENQCCRGATAFLRDITERRHTERALDEERGRLADILEGTQAATWEYQCAQGQLTFNDRYASMLGHDQQMLPVSTWEQMHGALHPDDQPRVKDLWERHLSGRLPGFDTEFRVRHCAGHWIWVLSRGKVVSRDSAGNALKVCGICMDVTERRAVEAAAHRINERFSLATASVGMGVWEYDIVAGTLAWDDRMYELFGRCATAGESPLAIWDDSLHPDDRAGYEHAMSAAVDRTHPLDTTFRIRLPDGTVRFLKAAAQVVRHDDGCALRVIGLNFDVTERMRIDSELNSTLTLLRAVLDSSTQTSIIAVKPDGLISVFNAGAERLLGWRRDEVVGRKSSVAFHEASEMMERAVALSAQVGRKVHTGLVLVDDAVLGQPQDWHYTRKDGTRVPVSLTVTAMRGEGGELFGYLGIAHDVSELKGQEKRLRLALHKAKQASQAKSQFLANMSHEIRTPMNAVIGLSYLLMRTSLDPDQSELVRKVKLAGKSLLGIINNVLDVSKIEAGELLIERAPFDLDLLLQELHLLASVQAEAKGIEFICHRRGDDAGSPLGVYEGDAVRLHQVLLNLVNNAVKFTDQGAVKLAVYKRPAASGLVNLYFAVSDTGIGIGADALPRLFQPFAQADASTTRRFGGTGLGLSIVRQLVTLMGGEVGASSTPGEGSEFWIELTLPACDPAQVPTVLLEHASPDQGALSGTRVLVVDDSAINREVAKRILELHGAKVTLAGDGQQAVDRLVETPSAFDVVLMDVQMPVLDGLDATRRIRSGLGLTRLPIVALTAGALGAEKQSAEAAGMNGFLTKPFEPTVLVQCIRNQLLPGGRIDVAAEPAPAADLVNEPPALAGWPVIEGIDSAQANRRLGGDVDLFLSMVKRLLDEAAELTPSSSPSTSPLAELATRLHRLKGGAGNLSAHAIHELAGEAESACRRGETQKAHALTAALATQMQRLQQAAEPALAAHAARARLAEGPGGASPDLPMDFEGLKELISLLRDFDLNAGQRFGTLAPQLRQHLGGQAYLALSEQIANLQYRDAVVTLEQVHDLRVS